MRHDQSDVGALTRQIYALRRRAARQKRNVKASAAGWPRWSTTMDEIVTLTERLLVSPTSDLATLAHKLDAILWLIEVNDSDSTDLHRLRRFRRDLAAFAGNER